MSLDPASAENNRGEGKKKKKDMRGTTAIILMIGILELCNLCESEETKRRVWLVRLQASHDFVFLLSCHVGHSSSFIINHHIIKENNSHLHWLIDGEISYWISWVPPWCTRTREGGSEQSRDGKVRFIKCIQKENQPYKLFCPVVLRLMLSCKQLHMQLYPESCPPLINAISLALLLSTVGHGA